MAFDPDYGEVYFNYGNLLSDERKFGEAAKRYLRLKNWHAHNLFNCYTYFIAAVMKKRLCTLKCMPRP